MKKKVMNGKKAGLKILVSAMIFVGLFLAGCGKNKTTNVSDNKQTIEAPADTPAPTVTPEVTIDPEIAKQEEEKRIEEAAKAYYERLSAVPGFPYSYEQVLSQVEVYNYHFDQSKLGTQTDIDLYVREIGAFPVNFTNVLLFNDDAAESTNVNVNVETYKTFLGEAKGKDILKIVEELGAKVYSSRRNDREAFEENARLFLSLIGRIYFSQTSSEANWNGIPIPWRTEMDNFVEREIRYKANGYLAIILNDKVGNKLTASDNKCYTAQKLIEWLTGGMGCENVSIYEQDSSQMLALILKNSKEKSLALTNEQ